MRIKTIRLGMIATNCYMFRDEGSAQCAVVDPGDDGRQVADFLLGMGLTPVGILLTHSHFDHILGIPGLRESWPDLPVWCHPDDVDPGQSTVSMFGVDFPSISSFHNILPYREGDAVQVGPLSVKVLHTPGHTPGSVTLQVEDVLFTGDTLFKGSAGRTDLAGGDHSALMASLRRLYALPGDFRVLPGHEGASTLAEERLHNPVLREALAHSA